MRCCSKFVCTKLKNASPSLVPVKVFTSSNLAKICKQLQTLTLLWQIGCDFLTTFPACCICTYVQDFCDLCPFHWWIPAFQGSNGVVPGNVEQVFCVALQRLKTVLCSVVCLDTQSLDLGNFKQYCQHFMGKMGLWRWPQEQGNHSACLWCH